MNATPDSTTTPKRCSTCKQEFPATLEYFHRDANGRYGLCSRCKTCNCQHHRTYYADNRDEVLSRQRVYREAHVDSIRERDRAYRKVNAESARASARAWNEANPERARAKERAWREANPEKAREQKRAWREANPVKLRVQLYRRKARKRSLPDTLTHSEWQHALDHFNGCCAVCGRPPGLFHTLAADHWIPLSSLDCPGTVATNMIPLCHGVDGCNNSKQDKPAVKWLIETLGKRKAKEVLSYIQVYFDSVALAEGRESEPKV